MNADVNFRNLPEPDQSWPIRVDEPNWAMAYNAAR